MFRHKSNHCNHRWDLEGTEAGYKRNRNGVSRKGGKVSVIAATTGEIVQKYDNCSTKNAPGLDHTNAHFRFRRTQFPDHWYAFVFVILSQIPSLGIQAVQLFE